MLMLLSMVAAVVAAGTAAGCGAGAELGAVGWNSVSPATVLLFSSCLLVTELSSWEQ